ncbi:hypothetical protein NC99_12880 [Sunxiuqinia dokdonensis]|uniref:Translocation and assembly module TamB C-terminal domain-containing protein n=2 Tax=Sunxiuqinia dokdonensis TaxID=1409788 RepID=A0A0L8VCJ0_9BACT|nr:hypothetical protein NC99_12880 [Sunxiuqinia dokdonensis]
MKDDMKKVITYSLRILGYLFLTVVIVLLLAGLLIQTAPVKRKLAGFAGEQASAVMNGQLTIGKLDGNFFTNLHLQDILLKGDSDTIAFIGDLRLDYNLWPLLDNKLQVHRVHIGRPYFYLEQQADSSWNVQQLVKPSGEETDTSQTSSTFELDVAQFNLAEGAVRIHAFDTLIPRRIENLNTKLSLQFSADRQMLVLDEFSLLTQQPDFELQQLAFQLNRNQEVIQLANFHLKTAGNQLDGGGNFAEAPARKGAARLDSEPLAIQEFEYFLSGFELPASPVFKLDASMDEDAISASIDLADGNQRIHMEVVSANLAAFLLDPEAPLLQYKLDGSFENIDLAHWLGNEELDYLVNGHVAVDGSGTDLETAVTKLKGEFNDLLVDGRPVADLLLNMDLDRGNLRGEVQGRGDFGSFHLKPDVQHLQAEPRYSFELRTEKLNLALLTGNDSLQSDFNLAAQVKGQGFDPKALKARGEIWSGQSRFQDIEVDTLFASLVYEKEAVQIDSLRLETKGLRVKAHGDYRLNGNSDLALVASFDGVEELASFIPLEDFATSGQLDARIWGRADSLQLESKLELNRTSFQSLTLESLLVDADGLLTKNDTTIQAKIRANQLLSDGFTVDSMAFDVDADLDSLYLDGRVVSDELRTELQAGLRLGDVMRIGITAWQIDFQDENWRLQGAPAIVEIDSVSYRLENFKLASGKADTSQYLSAQGIISRVGEEDFNLQVANIDLNKLLKLTGQEMNASGLINLAVDLSGTADDPLLTGDFGLEQAVMNDYRFTDFGGSLNYSEKQLEVQAQIVPQDSGRFEFSGAIPFELMLDSMGVKFNPKDSVDARLKIDQFPLAVLQAVNIGEEISGYLEGDVTVKGTIESPDPKGGFHLVDASLRIREYGVDYREIKFGIDFQGEEVLLDTLLIRSADGTLSGGGKIGFSSDFYKGDVSDTEIKLQFNQFNPVNHKQFNMQLSGNASLGGSKDDVKFDGDLNVPKSEIYLPAIFNLMGKMVETEMPKPILVRELEGLDSDTIDSVNVSQIDSTATDSLKFDYFDNLTGEVRLKIPKNTWIKNEDMHIEISGDLEMIKHKEFFELFGSVEVVRGQYDLFGRTFMIQSGTISFQGGEELMPRMDITASYSFRNSERVQQELSVAISGTAEEPSVSFSLDGSSVSEGDALSYILFGKSMNELTMDQQENVSGAGDMAGQAAASILSSQLTNFLGDKLNVDYIEVKSEGNFENATVVVGKYITNDLFVSYEQRFGETDQKDMAKYEVKLEYELFRFLFFQLNNSSNDSGFDVIFKFDAE